MYVVKPQTGPSLCRSEDTRFGSAAGMISDRSEHFFMPVSCKQLYYIGRLSLTSTSDTITVVSRDVKAGIIGLATSKLVGTRTEPLRPCNREETGTSN